MAYNPDATLDDILGGLDLGSPADEEVRGYAQRLLDDGVPRRRLLAKVAARFRGRVPGKHVAELVESFPTN